jgi:hypothetical protein
MGPQTIGHNNGKFKPPSAGSQAFGFGMKLYNQFS